MTNIIKGITFSIVIMLAIYGFLNLFTFNKVSNINDKEYRKEIRNNYKIYNFPLPKKLKFAGEKVPLENYDVRESLDFEILKVAYWHSELFLYLKRANRYFPIIEPILKKNNMPDDLKYFAIAESGLTNAVSPAGARGVWQFMKATAKEYGMEVSTEVDERYNLEKSTQAACEYFRKSHNKYKSWALVAASYNVGAGRIDDRLEEQNVESYYDLLLNKETSRYVYRTIAIKLIMENPKDYGFNLRKQDLYPVIPTTEIKIDTTIENLTDFAELNGINYKMLKYQNPWLRRRQLTNKKAKEYIIKIPKKNSRTYKYYKDIKEDEIIKSTE